MDCIFYSNAYKLWIFADDKAHTELDKPRLMWKKGLLDPACSSYYKDPGWMIRNIEANQQEDMCLPAWWT